MINVLRINLLIILLIFSKHSNVYAQLKVSDWQIGYFSPYISNLGCVAGVTLNLKNGEMKPEKKSISDRMKLAAQLSYFSQLSVSNNILFNPQVLYRWQIPDKRFYLSSSIGTGYLLSIQKQEGLLNLASGEFDYRHEVINSFLPNIQLGFGAEPKRRLGFFLTFCYGSKLSLNRANEGFLCFSTGLILKLKSTYESYE